MKKMMTAFNRTLAYFFTPEDSSAMAGAGSLSFRLSREDLTLGCVKVLFWMAAATGALYLIDMI